MSTNESTALAVGAPLHDGERHHRGSTNEERIGLHPPPIAEAVAATVAWWQTQL